MYIFSDCGTDIGPIVCAINSGTPILDEDAKTNYHYEDWTLLHCAAFAGRGDVVKLFLKYGASIYVEGSYIDAECCNTPTPRSILATRYPALLKELEDGHHI